MYPVEVEVGMVVVADEGRSTVRTRRVVHSVSPRTSSSHLWAPSRASLTVVVDGERDVDVKRKDVARDASRQASVVHCCCSFDGHKHKKTPPKQSEFGPVSFKPFFTISKALSRKQILVPGASA